MNRSHFPLFHSHLDLAHQYWSRLVKKGDWVIDATCGNGRDSLELCLLTLSEDSGKVFCFDKQLQAIESTRHFLKSNLPVNLYERVYFEERCHSTYPSFLEQETIKLIVYNLGYLPGGDKAKTTEMETTLQSLRAAMALLCSGGVISLTCYPGHLEGKREELSLLDFTSTLSPKEWSCCHHTWLNRKQSPSLLLLQKA